MRLNPFVSSSRDQDDVAVARLSKRNQHNNNNNNNRNRRPSQQQQRSSSANRKKHVNAPPGRGRSSSQSRNRSSSGRDAPPGDDDMMNTSASNLSYAGGSGAARHHVSRGRAPPTTPRRKSNSNIKVLGTAEGAGGRGGARQKREPTGPIDLDKAMDREMERRRSRSRTSQQRRPSTNVGAAASKASRPSKAATSRTYSLSSSFEEDNRNPAEDDNDDDDDSNSDKEMDRSRYSRRPSQAAAAAARRGRSRERVTGGPEDEDDDNQAEEGFVGSGSRAKVIPSRRGRSGSRNRGSRDVSPLSTGITDDEDEACDRAGGATPHRRRPSQQPQQRPRSVSRNSRGGRSTSSHHRRASASPGPPPARRRRPSQHRSSGGGGAAGDRGDRGQISRNRNTNIKSNSKGRSKNQTVDIQDNPTSTRKSWGKMLASPFMSLKAKSKKPDAPQYDEDDADILSDTGMDDDEYYPEEEEGERRRVPRRGGGRREASDDYRYGPAPVEKPQPPKFDVNKVIKVSDSYLVPKPETYANLYEYDNFPAIDRVPTAIGYRSDDSLPDDADEGDDKSFTSRYTIDVKSVRSSKLKKKNDDGISIYGHREDGDFSHDENDDKYAQYLAGAEANEVLSDSSESCPPKWHAALDAEDGDWFDDDDEEAMKRASGKNKKYQVSSKDKQKRSSNKKSKKAAAKAAAAKRKAKGAVPVANAKEEAALNAEAKLGEEGEAMGDAIVANRSEGSDLRPKRRQQRSAMGLSEDSDEETEGDDDDMTGARSQRRKQRGGRKDFVLGDSSMLTDNSYEEMDKPSKAKKGIMMNPNISQGKVQNVKALKAKAKSRGLVSKFKGFRRGGRVTDDASSSDDSSYGTDNMHLDPSQSIYSGFDQSLAQLEDDEWRESTATHNMMRNNRKELLELDEMDEASVKVDPNQVSCSIFPFGLTALALGGGNSTSCFYNQSGEPQRPEDAPLDSVQIQRLKDAKYDMENKPKVEVILQDLQDPLADKFDKLEKSKQKHKRELQREQEFQQEIERKERAELLRKKKEIREAEQKKVQLAQKQDLDLQEAPDLNRGKSQSFVMDITDWVLQLDNDTPRRKSLSTKDHAPTPRTNGRNEPSPIDELPFSTISVPTATMDSDDIVPKQAWRRGKKEKKPTAKKGTQEKRRTGPKNSSDKKKKGWFRR